MRNLTNISKSEQDRLRRVFPELVSLICDIEPYDYKKTFVSIFDHCLSREEASDLLDNVLPEEQKRRNYAFNRFNEKLIQSTVCYKVALRGIKKDRVLFKQFNTAKAALKCVNPNSWPHFVVALPEYEAIYHQSWDDTAIFFYINDKVTGYLKDLASKSGLHVYT